MTVTRQAHLLRVYVNAREQGPQGPVYQSIVRTARASHLAGASVFLVDLSFGTHRRLRDVNSDYLFVDVPVVIEMVDAPEAVEAFRQRIAPLLADSFATEEKAEVWHYGHHEGPRERTSQTDHPSPAVPAFQEDPTMPVGQEAQRVTVYLGSSDTWHGANLASAIVERCRQMGLAGATASLGVMGFGKHSRIHRAHMLGLSEDLPERIEIVDRPDRIARLLPVLQEMVQGGLVIVQTVHVLNGQEHLS